jgi:hypothetical protein
MLIRKLRTWIRLPGRDKLLILKTVILVGLIRLGLWLLPFRIMRRIGEKSGRIQGSASAIGSREIVWAVRLASRYVPRATCLVKAMAAQILLARHGYSSELHIGVAMSSTQGFHAHAWVESSGEVLIGDSEEHGAYSSLLVLDSKSR